MHALCDTIANILATSNSAPYSLASEVWGEDNFNRLVEIKEKYDPQCLFNRGRVIATDACKSKELANTYIE